MVSWFCQMLVGFAKILIDPGVDDIGVSHLNWRKQKPSKVSISVSATLAGKARHRVGDRLQRLVKPKRKCQKKCCSYQKPYKMNWASGTSSKMNTRFFC